MEDASCLWWSEQKGQRREDSRREDRRDMRERPEKSVMCEA